MLSYRKHGGRDQDPWIPVSEPDSDSDLSGSAWDPTLGRFGRKVIHIFFLGAISTELEADPTDRVTKNPNTRDLGIKVRFGTKTRFQQQTRFRQQQTRFWQQHTRHWIYFANFKTPSQSYCLAPDGLSY
jgi:hypothetical protein